MKNFIYLLTVFISISSSAVQAQSLSSFRLDLQSYSLQCKIKVLEKMGWNVQYAPIEEPRMEESAACSTSSLASTSKLLLPVQPNPESDYTIPFVNRALRGTPTLCAYHRELNPAVQKATKSLSTNHLYFFKPFWRNDNIRMEFMKESWQRQNCGGEKCYSPQDNLHSRAILQLSRSIFSSDCATGLMLAEYRTAYELFGYQDFQKKFKSEEIFVGDWEYIAKSKSFTRGVDARKVYSADGLKYAELGAEIFPGISGVIASVFDRSFVDDIINVNENFIFVKISDQGAKNLKNNGGLSFYNQFLKSIWEKTKILTNEELIALENIARQGRLAQTTDLDILRAMPTAENNPIPSDLAVEVAHQLSEPFLLESKIYVHPVGVKSFSWHLLRLARLNRRTPYEIRFYQEAIHGELYDRWMQAQFEMCENAQ